MASTLLATFSILCFAALVPVLLWPTRKRKDAYTVTIPEPLSDNDE